MRNMSVGQERQPFIPILKKKYRDGIHKDGKQSTTISDEKVGIGKPILKKSAI